MAVEDAVALPRHLGADPDRPEAALRACQKPHSLPMARVQLQSHEIWQHVDSATPRAPMPSCARRSCAPARRKPVMTSWPGSPAGRGLRAPSRPRRAGAEARRARAEPALPGPQHGSGLPQGRARPGAGMTGADGRTADPAGPPDAAGREPGGSGRPGSSREPQASRSGRRLRPLTSAAAACAGRPAGGEVGTGPIARRSRPRRDRRGRPLLCAARAPAPPGRDRHGGNRAADGGNRHRPGGRFAISGAVPDGEDQCAIRL